MYTLMILVLLGVAATLLVRAVQKRSYGMAASGASVALVTLLFFSFLWFWTEVLWFDNLGYGQRFWTVVLGKAGFALLGAFASALVLAILGYAFPKEKKWARRLPVVAGGCIGAVWGYCNWDTILKYWNRVSAGIVDPILERDASFYLFTLPLYDALYLLVLVLSLVLLACAISIAFFRFERGELKFREQMSEDHKQRPVYGPLYISAGLLLIVLAWGKYLNRYHLLYSSWGAVSGPGWTDVHVRLPAYALVSLFTALVGVVLLVRPLRQRVCGVLRRAQIHQEDTPGLMFGTAAAVVVTLWVLAFMALPGLFQWLRVEPNEITFETPYIGHNIRFTRYGFKLHDVEEREFPASVALTPHMVENNKKLFDNVRLWDWRALAAVYKQFQEMRLYYEFADVDLDRYHIGDSYRQVMVSPRELELDNLPEQSKTFVNRRFKYTHGYGITFARVNGFTSQGLPDLLVKDIPPASNCPGLAVDQGRIYFGELTRSYVVVNSMEEEFDYPSGDENAYIHYPGTGGIPLSSLWRKFLFGWRFDGTRFFLSRYSTEKSRIMFRRQIHERVKALAPFLQFDNDPYIALVGGALCWIIDGYTSSKYFPYSEPFTSKEFMEYTVGKQVRALSPNASRHLRGVNYLRNSVKAVVDAFDGSVVFYIFEEDDPLIQTWARIFPGLFKKKESMPKELFAHIRYPIDMLLVQGLVYAKYHMKDPAVFYNQEDLWIRATEKYYQHTQPVEPYYIMWKAPESESPEFVLILPFTPKKRQVLIGWIAGMCDGDNYGRLLAYKFPKDKRILGPQQVETKIDQDSFLSGQLTLWDQRGSHVIRGNVLALPVENTIIYVEPIYLQAETAAYPELRLVAVMHGDNLSYAETFEEALRGLFGERKASIPLGDKLHGQRASVSTLVRTANQAFEDYLRHLGNKRFEETAQALAMLQDSLRELSKEVLAEREEGE
jgi:uncharacterized membrane protein (UPF0182 family)